MPQHMLASGRRYLLGRVRFTFFSDMTEVEQRYVIKILHIKKFKESGGILGPSSQVGKGRDRR
jgi:hypothetical protein